MRDTVDQILTLARMAQTEAISTAQVHRLTVDGFGRCYVSKQEGEQFVALGESRDAVLEMPDGVKVQMTDLQARDFVEFYPSGRMQTARIRVTMEERRVRDGDRVRRLRRKVSACRRWGGHDERETFQARWVYADRSAGGAGADGHRAADHDARCDGGDACGVDGASPGGGRDAG